jgi:hypothetical protein
MNHKFGITEDSIVHRYDNGCGWRLLGRLPSILGEPTPIGREVRDWWKALVESDEPCPILVLQNSRVGGGNSRRRGHPRHWADISGSSTRCTPSRPMTLGKESVTPNVAL